MPMHDWTRVEAAIYHAYHHKWISEISRALNRGLLPEDLYALPEQQAAGFSPDVRTLQVANATLVADVTIATRAKPTTNHHARIATEFHRRMKSSIAVRHLSGDRIVAIIEVLSPGNKNNAHAFRSLVERACKSLEHRIHLLLIDPFPPRRHDPDGIHAAIWSM
jgi:hypothetical protein